MRAFALPASVPAALLLAASCTNVITVHEYHTAKPHARVDTVYVIVDPSWSPDGEGGCTPPGTWEGEDPLVTWYELYGGAGVETCSFRTGEVKHTLIGNAVTGSGPALTVDARVWRKDGTVTDLDMILEFGPLPAEEGTAGPGYSEGTRGRTSNDGSGRWYDPDIHEDSPFLVVQAGDAVYGYDLDDCSWIDVTGEGEEMSVQLVLPVSLALLRDLAHGSSSSFTLAYPGSGVFTKYFTEMNDGNLYSYYTVFVVGDGNPEPSTR